MIGYVQESHFRLEDISKINEKRLKINACKLKPKDSRGDIHI